ncbi:hypothetical protein G6F68_011832 [Rhizopus microsporus]|nr:hypothetical protein G6F68_011832 [Rhizopus microsporus]
MAQRCRSKTPGRSIPSLCLIRCGARACKKDRAGDIVFPPLWGDESFNIGAGLARTYKAAAFIRNSMPMGVNTHGNWGEGDVLSDQDAVDVAEYFTHMPRPDFAGKEKDFPNGKKPKDSRY